MCSLILGNGTQQCGVFTLAHEVKITNLELRGKYVLLFYPNSSILHEEDFFHKFHLNIKKKLKKFYIWGIALYGDISCTLLKVDHIYLEGFQMW
jgi:hypothetical protein